MLRELVDIVGGPHVVTDADTVASQFVDWTGRFSGRPTAVIRPGSTEEVEATIATCRNMGVAIVPQGGNTGMVGGSIPLHGELVLDLRRLDHIDPVDPVARQVTAGAGATVAAVQA
ncbi:MAG: FAD-binding oxidoreductase, partial [Ilumatobacteraceae bacterium]